MALRFALAALTFGAAAVKAQLTDRSNFYSVSDDYYNYGNTRRSSSTKTSMFWTVTVREMDSVSFEAYTYARTTTTYDYTYTRTIKPSVTPTVTPTYTASSNGYYDNLEMHVEYYATGAVAESDLVPLNTADYNDYDYSSTASSTRSVLSSTRYYMPVTMTAPASCPTVFTVATQATVTDIPTLVTDQLKPTSTDASTTTYRSYDIVYATWYLTEGAAPFTSTDDYYYSYYIKSCTPPPAQYTDSGRTYGGSGGGSSSSGSGSDSDSWTDYRTCYFGGCTTLKVWIIIIATILPGIFLLGFLESFFWYTRLMKGKSAIRGGTVCWIFLSLWVMCFTRMQDARSKEDQKLLQQKWKEMPAGQKFKNWSWGFRRRYPVPLLGQYSSQTVGIVPEGQPLHPAMAQAPAGQVFYYGPPPPPGAPGAPGYPMPPQGYPQQQNGYYPTNVPKQGVVVGSSSTSGTVTPPQTPQPVYQPPTSPPPTTQLPPQPKQDAPLPAPPAGVNEAPAQTARAAPSEQAPPATAAEVTPAPATTQPQPTHPAPVKNDTNDDLYK